MTWAGTWFAGAIVLSPLIATFTPFSALRFVVLVPWLGALSGIGFSIYLGALGGKPLLPDLRAGRIALGAGVLMGLATLGVGAGLAAISGSPLPWVGASTLGGVLGALTGASAFASIHLAQHSIEAGPTQQAIAPSPSRVAPEAAP